jgi:hypothetical protein
VSIAQQSVAELGGAASVLVRQRRDHAELNVLLQRLRTAEGAEQDELLTRTARLVFPHAYAEEVVLWPAMRAVLPDGDELTLRVEQEHQEINELFSTLERTPHGDPARRVLLDRITVLLREDVRDEEDLLLPRLQGALDPEELRALGRRWELVRRTAPTRPHAVVSRRPPGNALSGLPLAVVDRLRDRSDRMARRSPGLVGSASRTASRVLARLAGGVEHLPVLRAGERSSTRAGRTEAGR